MVALFTPAEDQRIIELFDKGYAMSAIGDQLNRSRGAIAGRIRRLRKKLLTENTNTSNNSVSRFQRSQEPRVRLRMIDDETTEVTLQELELHHCKWPKGDPRHSDFRFCGAQRISENERTPYCKEHTLMASNKQQY